MKEKRDLFGILNFADSIFPQCFIPSCNVFFHKNRHSQVVNIIKKPCAVFDEPIALHSPILSSPSPSHSLPLFLSPSTSTYPWNSVDFAHRPRSCDKSQCFSTWRSARTSCGEPTATPFPTKRSDHRGCNNGQHPQVHLVAPEWLQHTCGGQGKLAVWWAQTKDCHRMYFFFLLYFLLWFSIFCFWFSILYFYFFNLWYSGSCTN